MTRLKTEFLELYRAAYNNAIDLLSEAEILFDKEKYARAYFLAFTGLEEISKSQLAADLFTEFIGEEEFKKCYTNHRAKIERMAWASEDAQRYLDVEEETYIYIEEPTIAARMNALYVHFDGKRVQSPGDIVRREDAKSIIHTLRVAIERIIEVTEYWGHQIGTKGFMK